MRHRGLRWLVRSPLRETLFGDPEELATIDISDLNVFGMKATDDNLYLTSHNPWVVRRYDIRAPDNPVLAGELYKAKVIG